MVAVCRLRYASVSALVLGVRAVNFGAASGASRSNEEDTELSLGVNNLRGVRLCCRRGAACKEDFRFVPPILVVHFGSGDGGVGPKIVLSGLGDRIERLWACLTGVIRGWEDEEV